MSGTDKLLKGTRAEIAQGRMTPRTAVPNLNIFKDGQSSQGSCLEGEVSTFVFQGRPETLFHGIVVTASNGTHADLHLSLFQQSQIGM